MMIKITRFGRTLTTGAVVLLGVQCTSAAQRSSDTGVAGAGGGSSGNNSTASGGAAGANSQPTAGSAAVAGANAASGSNSGGASATDAGTDGPVVPPPPDPVIMLKTGSLKLEVWGERTIRVLYSSGASVAAETGSLAVNEARPVTPFTISDSEAALTVTISASKLSARVDKNTGQLTFLDANGVTLLRDATNNARTLSAGMAGGQPTQVAQQSFETSTTESFYGLGQHQQGSLTYNGRSVTLQQQNPGESGVPVLVSSAGYGVLWDNPSQTTVDLSKAGTLTWKSAASTQIDYYFMAGPEPDQIIAQYRALTGAPPLFGRWAWGFWQSKEHYGSQAELLGVVSKYRSMMLPLDGIIQDWQYWSPAAWGSHQFNAQNYPDPAGMFAQAHTNHVHALISVWARFDKANYANYNALNAAGALVEPGFNDFTYYDPFKLANRQLYWQQMHDELFTKGVDGWWLDSTEPDLGGGWGTDKTAMGPGAFVFNAFPLMTTTAVFEGQRAATAEQRVFLLTRSAYTGEQRNAATVWSGDIHGDWPTFKAQIPAGLNFSLSGIPYWNTDIGGFYPQSNPGMIGTPGYTELFERWFQFGAFCTMFRSHGTGGDKNMYSFGAAAQAVLLGVDQLRYRLLPYMYSLSWMVTHQGYTVMRGFVFDFRADAKALGVADQFMFGPALMVNPVTAPNVTTRSVYLPANTTWYDFWTGASQAGGQTVNAAAPIEHLPLYVRAGSILPMGPALQYATEKPSDPTELRVYKGANGTFTLYEDENDNYNYEKGMYATIPFIWDDASKTLHIGARSGSFPGMLMNRTFQVVFVDTTHGIGTAPSATIDKSVTYSGTAVDVSAP